MFKIILTLRSSVSTIKWLFFIVIVINDPFAPEWWFICPAWPAVLSSHVIDVISAFDIKLSLLWSIPFASQSVDLSCHWKNNEEKKKRNGIRKPKTLRKTNFNRNRLKKKRYIKTSDICVAMGWIFYQSQASHSK